jgi:hypothetical protein
MIDISFLEDVKRVTQENYQPTPGGSRRTLLYIFITISLADVLRARVATMGPEEHHIQVESGRK